MVNALEIREHIADLTDATLVAALRAAQDEASRAEMILDIYKAEVARRLEATGGTTLMGDVADVEMTYTSPTYAPDVVLPLLEELPEREWIALYREETRTTVKVDGREVNKLLRKYGENTHIGQTLLRARIQGRPRITVKEKN